VVNYDEKYDHEESLIDYNMDDNFYDDKVKNTNKFIIKEKYLILINKQILYYYDLENKRSF
jgi:hypothetical protein